MEVSERSVSRGDCGWCSFLVFCQILLDSSGTLKFGDFTRARFLSHVDPSHLDSDKSTKTAMQKTKNAEPSVCLNDSVPEVRPHTPGAFLPSSDPVNEVDSRDIPLPFLSPECRRGEIPAVSSDLWGLGCLLYSLYCGTCTCCVLCTFVLPALLLAVPGYPPQETSEYTHTTRPESVFELPGKNQVGQS